MSVVFKIVIHSDVFFLSTDFFPGLSSLQHDADAVISDPHLSLQLKSAAQSALKKITGEVQDEVPVLMSGAGHDAMALSYLTKVIELKLKNIVYNVYLRTFNRYVLYFFLDRLGCYSFGVVEE